LSLKAGKPHIPARRQSGRRSSLLLLERSAFLPYSDLQLIGHTGEGHLLCSVYQFWIIYEGLFGLVVVKVEKSKVKQPHLVRVTAA
jgi:hypothetical protein